MRGLLLSEPFARAGTFGNLMRRTALGRTVPANPTEVDELDLAILRRMYRNGLVNLAGIDPRLNATRVARSLGIGRARVAARLQAWRASGFLQNYSVWLNPAYIGWHGAWVALRVDRSSAKAELFRRASWVDGVVSGMDYLGEWVSLSVVAPDPASLERRVGLLRNLGGVVDAEPPLPWRVPEPRRALTPLDIRIVRALRQHPTATLGAIARRVGVSTRTMTRKYSALIEDWAVWFVPMFDFRRIARPVVALTVKVAAGTAHEPVVRRIRAQFPLMLESASGVVGIEAAANEMFLAVVLPSIAVLEELEQLARSPPGVTYVETNVIVRMYDFPDWFDRHLDSIAAAAQARRGTAPRDVLTGATEEASGAAAIPAAGGRP